MDMPEVNVTKYLDDWQVFGKRNGCNKLFFE